MLFTIHIFLGNINLVHLTSDELSHRYICDNHFVDEDYTNNQKCRLTRTAVPIKYEDIEHLHVITPTKVYQKIGFSSPTAIETISKNGSPSVYVQTPSKMPSRSDNIFIRSTSSTPVLTPKTRTFIEESHEPTGLKPKILFSNNSDNKISKLKLALQLKKKQIRNKNASLLKLKKNLKILRESKKNKSTLLDCLYYPSTDSKTLVKMQVLRPKFSRKKFTKNEQNFALGLFYKSPSAYKFLKNNKQLTLPGLSTIRRWIGNSKFKPGFNAGIFKQLKKKGESMSKDELYCTLIFDEMKIKNYLEYSKFLDVVEGFEDLGPHGRSNKLAGQAMVFMIRGLYSSWKMPICYFLPATSVKNNILSELIIETVQRLLNCGFFIKAVICDQGTNNVSALGLLKVTKDKPFFEVDGKRIYSIFDTPHLFKNFRNHFIKSNFKFQNEEVSFQDVRNVYKIDKNSTTSRSLLKITENHINPGPFQMMSCKLAMQIFSNTMAVTIKTCVYTGELKSKTALYTANMIKFLNDLLDVLNSMSLYNSNPFKCAISETRPQQLQFLEKARLTFETLEKMDVKNKKSKTTRPLCFDGMCWTINSIIMLYNEQKEIGFSYILTGRLNSDVIENTFSVFRQRGGYNRNPTARIFRTTFRLNAKMSLMKPSSSSNCEPDDDTHLMTIEDNETKLLDMDSSFSSASSVSTLSIDNSLEEQEAVINLKNCSNSYFAGYLAMKCLLKFSCSNCEQLMIKSGIIPNQLEYLIFCKNYDSKTSKLHLKVPTTAITEFVISSQKILAKILEKKPHKIKISQLVGEQIKTNLMHSLIIEENCIPHLEFLIKHLIICKLFRNFNWCSKNLKHVRSEKSKKKLKILNNI